MHRTGHVRGRGGPLVVAGVSGGVGASTLAALLAQERSRAGRVVLMDLGAGGGLDVLLGLERVPGARWPDLDGLHGAVAPQDLDGLLPRWRSVEVLSASRHGAPPGVDAVAEVVDAFRGAGAFVVVDAAQRGGTRREVAARVAGELLLVAGQDVLGLAAVLAARRTVDGLGAQLVLRRRRSRIAPDELAHVADLPLVGLLPHDRRLPDAVDRGLGPVAGGRLRRAVVAIDRRLGRQ